jgi:hypothetical protein
MNIYARIITSVVLTITVIVVVNKGITDQNQSFYYITIVGALIGMLAFVIISRPGPRIEARSERQPDEAELEDEVDNSRKDKRDELILDLIKRRYDSELARLNSIDSKGGNLIGFVSVIVGLLVGIAGLEFIKEISTPLSAIPYFIGLGMLVASISCALYAIKVRTYLAVPDASRLLERYVEAEYRVVIRRVAGTMRDSINQSETVNNIKARWIDRSWYFLIGGLFFIVVFILFTAISSDVHPPSDIFPSPRLLPV